MTGMLRRCLLMSVGALALAGVLLAVGVPGAVLLGFAPLVVCVGMHLLMGHGATHSQYPLATAQHAGVPHEGQEITADPAGATR